MAGVLVSQAGVWLLLQRGCLRQSLRHLQGAPGFRLPAGFGDKPSWTKRRAGRQRRAWREAAAARSQKMRVLRAGPGCSPPLLARPGVPSSTGDTEQVPVGLGCRWDRPEACEPLGLIAEIYVPFASCPEYSPGRLGTVTFETTHRVDCLSHSPPCLSFE